MIKISVIIPVYNTETYLEKCLDSIVNQTLKDFEIICVNDGSTDNSSKILESFAKKDSRIKIINGKNQGAGAARNEGLKIAKGEYVAFVDADDFIEKQMFSQMYNKAKNHDADICFCNYIAFDNGTGQKQYKTSIPKFLNKEVFSKNDFPEKIFQTTDPNVWTKLYKRSFIQFNQITFSTTRTINDVFFGYAALFTAQRIVWCKEQFVHYRRNIQSSLTKSDISENIRNTVLNISALAEYLDTGDFWSIYGKSLTRRFTDSLEYCLQHVPSNEISAKMNELRDLQDSFYPKFLNEPSVQKNFLKSDKISIIIPVYNVKNYLEQCLKSVVNQTHKNLEIICINDGVTDGCEKILDDFARQDERIKIITQKNGGISKARNTGIDNVTGDYILFVDSDDWCSHQLVEKLYKDILMNNTDFSVCAAELFDEEKHEFRNDRYYSLEDFKKLQYRALTFEDLKNSVFSFPVMAWGKLIRTDIIKKNNIRFLEDVVFEDNPFFFDLLLSSCDFSIICEKLLFYRVNRKNSITQAKNEKYFDYFKHYVFIKEKLIESGKYNAVIKNYWEYVFFNFRYAFSEIRVDLRPLFYEKFMDFLNNHYKFGTYKKLDSFIKNVPIEKLLKYKFYNPNTFWQNIFSARNVEDKKVLTFLFLKCSFKKK